MGAADVNLLVVEDDADTRETLADLLSLEGFTVRVAEDGERALEAVRADPPALVLLDLMMPNVDGSDFVRALRADPAIAAIPVIVLTASGLPLPHGVVESFRKPFNVDEVVAAIRRVLAQP